jgi:hypothetical protein
MPKTKKARMGRATAAALKAMEKMVFETGDLNVQLKQLNEKLSPAGITVSYGSIAYAGRNSSDSGQVMINAPTGGNIWYASTWPEWAYGVAEGALHFNQQVLVTYNDVPFGVNLLDVFCTNVPAQPGNIGEP